MPRPFIVALLAAGALCAQDDASALLSRARDKILDSTRRLPKYTCLETIDRTYYVAQQGKLSRRAMTEAPANATCVAYGSGQVSMEAKDRLRVEVAVAGQTEIHSWPGASSFDTRPLDQIIPFGPISTGSFGAFLLDLFANRIAEFNFTGRRTDGPRGMFAYSYRVPQKVSRYRVGAPNRWEIAGYSGSIEVNDGTAELARLVIETDQLGPETLMCHAKTTIDYHFILIGYGEFLIPRRSEFQTLSTNGYRTDSVTDFSRCHEYTAESSIRFDDPVTAPNSPAKASVFGAALRPGVSLTLALMDPIDTHSAAAGDPVRAKVVKTIRAPGSQEILVPAGAIARGRILEMRHQYKTSECVVSIRFDTLGIGGAVSPLSVRLDRELKAEKHNAREFATRGTEFSLPSPTSFGRGSQLLFTKGAENT